VVVGPVANACRAGLAAAVQVGASAAAKGVRDSVAGVAEPAMTAARVAAKPLWNVPSLAPGTRIAGSAVQADSAAGEPERAAKAAVAVLGSAAKVREGGEGSVPTAVAKLVVARGPVVR